MAEPCLLTSRYDGLLYVKDRQKQEKWEYVCLSPSNWLHPRLRVEGYAPKNWLPIFRPIKKNVAELNATRDIFRKYRTIKGQGLW